MLRKGKFYSTKEVEAKAGISRQALYQWERKGLIKAPLRDQLSNRRLYSKRDIDTIIKLRQGVRIKGLGRQAKKS